MSDAVDRILGGGHPACSFLEVGRTYEGVVVGEREVQGRVFGTQELKTWPDGSPYMVPVFDLQTAERDPAIEDDDGLRSLYVDKKGIRDALASAFRAGGMKRGMEATGGTIKIKFTGYGEGKGAQPPKVFQAKFTPAPPSAVSNILADEPPEYNDEPF
jgi:hypothetical protein